MDFRRGHPLVRVVRAVCARALGCGGAAMMENIILLIRNEQSVYGCRFFFFLLDFRLCTARAHVLLCCSPFFVCRRRRGYCRAHRDACGQSGENWRAMKSAHIHTSTQQQGSQQHAHTVRVYAYELDSTVEMSFPICSLQLVQQKCIAILDGIRYIVHGTCVALSFEV